MSSNKGPQHFSNNGVSMQVGRIKTQQTADPHQSIALKMKAPELGVRVHSEGLPVRRRRESS